MGVQNDATETNFIDSNVSSTRNSNSQQNTLDSLSHSDSEIDNDIRPFQQQQSNKWWWKKKKKIKKPVKNQQHPEKKNGVGYLSLPHKDQILILVICRVIEPLTYNSISPYLYYMIESFGYRDPSTISSLGTVIMSAFALGQALTGVFWGSLSDRIGRKPVLLIGILGTVLATVMFGFSTNIYLAVFSRLLAGILNGNVGVMRTIIAELVADKKEYQARAFAVMPITFNIGTVLGPIIGGMLADPVTNDPDSFWAKFEIFKTFPYLLPNVFPIPMVVLAFLLCLFFLKETRPGGSVVSYESIVACAHKKLSNTKFLIQSIFTRKCRNNGEDLGEDSIGLLRDEAASIIVDSSDEDSIDDFPSSNNNKSRQQTSFSRNSSIELMQVDDDDDDNEALELKDKKEHTPTLRDALTYPVILTITCYTVLMLHCPAFLQMLPIFMATPRLTPPGFDPNDGNQPLINGTDQQQVQTVVIRNSINKSTLKEHLPFIFNGGLGMPPSKIGTAMAIMGCSGILLQFFLFPTVAAWLGNANCHKYILWAFPLAYTLIPFVSLLTRKGYVPTPLSSLRDSASNGTIITSSINETFIDPLAEVLSGTREVTYVDPRWGPMAAIVPLAMLVILGRTFAIPPMPVLITNAVKSRTNLGAVHGLTASVTSAAKCLGPFILGNVYSFGVHLGMIGLAWWAMAIVGIAGMIIGQRLKEWGEEDGDDDDNYEVLDGGEDDDEERQLTLIADEDEFRINSDDEEEERRGEVIFLQDTKRSLRV